MFAPYDFFWTGSTYRCCWMLLDATGCYWCGMFAHRFWTQQRVFFWMTHHTQLDDVDSYGLHGETCR